MNYVDSKLAALAQLEEGWDSYGGKQVDRAVIETVRSTLRAIDPVLKPRIVPCSDGGIQLEFSRGSDELEIEFAPGGKVTWMLCGEIDDSFRSAELEVLIDRFFG